MASTPSRKQKQETSYKLGPLTESEIESLRQKNRESSRRGRELAKASKKVQAIKAKLAENSR